MTTDFDTLLRETEPSVAPIDPSSVIRAAGARQRRRRTVVGGAVAAAVLAVAAVGWSASRVASGPLPAGPQPLTAQCAASQRHSQPPGPLVKSLKDDPVWPIGGMMVEGPKSPATAVRITHNPDGSYRMDSSAGPREVQGNITWPSHPKFSSLRIAGGSKCGLTLFADGKYRYLVAPVSPDATSVTVSGTGWNTGGPRLLSDGSLVVFAAGYDLSASDPIAAYWKTTDGSIVNSDSDDIRVTQTAGLEIAVNNTTNRASVAHTGDWVQSDWLKLPVENLNLMQATSQAVFILPRGAHSITAQIFADTNQHYTGAVRPAQSLQPADLTGTDYVALVIPTGNGSQGSAVARVDWVDAAGKSHTWRSGLDRGQ